MKPPFLLRLVRTGTLATLLAAQSATALDYAWDPFNDANGGSSTWDTSNTRWDAGTTASDAIDNIAWTNGADNRAYFGGTAGTVTLNTGITVGGLTFKDSPGYLLTGNTLTFGADGAITTNVDASIASVLAGSVPITKAGAGTLTLTGSNTFSGQLTVQEGTLKVATVNNTSANGPLGNSANPVILGKTGDVAGTLEYTGATASSTKPFTLATGGAGVFQVDTGASVLTLSGVIDGSGVLTKTGSGTLKLSNIANTYNGGTDIGDGVLALGSSGALGTSFPIRFLGGTLQFSAANTADYSGSFSTANYQVYNFDTNGQNVTLASPLSSTGGSLTKFGAGKLTLAAVNTYGYGTEVNGGTLAVTVDGALGASTGLLRVLNGAIVDLGTTNQTVDAVTLLLGGKITGSGTLTAASFDISVDATPLTISTPLAGPFAILTKSETGTLTLAGANTYGGGTTVSGGKLNFSGGGTLGAPTGTLTVMNGAILELAANSQTVHTVSLLYGGQITSTTGTLTATSFDVESGTISAKLEGGSLTKTDSATVTLSGVNTYGGATHVNAGILQINIPAALPGQTSPGLITVADGATLAVNVGGGTGFTATNISDLLTNATFANNALLGFNTTAAFNYNLDLTGAAGIRKLGTATLTLSGTANTYSGGTFVDAGTLALSGAATLGNGTGAITVDGTGAILSLAATSQAGGVVSVLNGGQITGTGTLTGTSYFVESGSISVKLAGDTATLTKSNSGTVTLSGANSYGGGTTVSSGTLTLSTTGALGAATGALTVMDGAIVNLGATNQSVAAVSLLNDAQLTGTGKLTGTSFHVEKGLISASLGGDISASLTKSGSGTVTLSGTASTYGGGTFLNEGTLRASKALSLPGSGQFMAADGTTLILNAGGAGEFAATNITTLINNATFANNTTLGIDTTGTFSCSSNLIGAFGLSKLGAGTLTLTGAGNTYTGGTSVTAGTLALSGSGKLGDASGALTVDGATTIVNLGSTTQTVGAVRLLNGAQVTGTGTLSGSSFTVQNGAISANLAGAGAVLIKETAGTVTLTGANTYDGGTDLTAGVLALGSSGALATSGPIRWLGGTLRFSASNNIDYSPRFITDPGQLFNFDTNGQSVTLASAIYSVGGSLSKDGAGTLTLSGFNYYDGPTEILAGTLQVTQAASLPGQTTPGLITVASGTTLAVTAGGPGEFTAFDFINLMTNAVFSNGSTLSIDTTQGDFDLTSEITQNISLVKLGGNTLTLSGANTYGGSTFLGRTTLADAGTLRLFGVGTLGTAGPFTLYGGLLDLNGTTQAITTLTLGEGPAASTAAIEIATGELQLGGNVEYRATNNPNGATIDGTGGGKLSLLGNRTFTVGNSTAATYDLTISAGLQNGDATPRALTKAGPGTLLLSGENTYTGVTSVSTGMLYATSPTALPGRTSAGKITVASGATLTVNAGGSGEFTPADLTTLLTNATFASATSILGIDTSNAAGGTFTAPNLTGARGLNKLGSGTLVLTGAGNTYSGTTTITAGSLILNGSLGTGGLMTLPTDSMLSIATGATIGRSVTVTGGLLNLSGILGTGTTLTLTSGTVNSLGTGGTAAIVTLPVPGATPVLSAPAGQELTVTNKLTQTLVGGSMTITAGTPAFKAGGSNLVSNIDKLILEGGTTKIERFVGAALSGVNMPTTELAMTATSTLNLGFAAKATMGNLSLAAGILTLQTATSASFNNISAAGISAIAAGVPLSLSTGNVTVADGMTLTVDPPIINDTAATVLNKLGGGTLILNGANTYTGTTTVTAGTLTVGDATALERSNVIFNGGVLDTGALTNVPLGGITANVNTTVNSVLTTFSGYPTWSAAAGKTLTISGSVTRAPGGAINFGTAGTITGAGLNTLLGTNTINPWATSGGTDWAIHDGSNIVTFTAYTAASGTATAPKLASVPGANSRIDDSTTNNVTLATTGTIDMNTLVINGNTARTIDVRNNTTQGILRLGTSGAILLAGGSHTIGLGGTPGTLTAGGATNNTAGDLSVMAVSAGTINSVIANNGTGKVSLTKYGSGTLTLAGANTFTGLTTVFGGTLSLSRSGGTLADLAPVTVSGGTLAVAQADTLGVVTLSSGTISGAGVLTGSSYALTDTGTISAILGGSGTLTKTGAGTATLTGTNTYTGLTDVQAGTLSLGHATNTIADTAAVKVSGGTLDVAKPDTVGVVTLASGTISGAGVLTGSSYALTDTGTISAILGGTGALTKTGAGTVTLTGANTYTGLTDVQEGTLSLARAGGTLAGAAVTVSGGTLDVAQADSVGVVTLSSGTISGAAALTGTSFVLTNTGTISAILAGTGTLAKTGAGTVTLTGANTYTGATTISGGTLSLARAGGTLAATAPVTVSGGMLDVAQADTVGVVTLSSGTISGAAVLTGTSYVLNNTGTISAALAGAVTLTKSGAGTATLSGTNSYTGITTISAGVLRLDSANALPGGIATAGGTSALTFNGGVLGLGTGDFTRGLNVAGTVTAATFTGNGGWAAYGADRVVNLGGAAASITWATVGTGFNAKTLILGASTATHTVDLRNPLDLGTTGVRTVQVDDGAAAIDGKLSGVLSGVGGGLTKTGTGTLVLTAANTYTGATTVGGGKLALDFSVTNPVSILSSSSALTLTGANLSLKGKSTGTTAQILAGLTLNAGNSVISVDANGGGGTLLNLGAITRTAGYIDFILPADVQSATNGITTTTPLGNGILGPYATVGSNWASLSGSNIVALGTYADIAALGSTIPTGAGNNVRINSAGTGANVALGVGTTAINTLLQNTSTATTVDTLGKTLQIGGIMLGSGQGALTIGAAAGNGILTAAAAGGELVLINHNTGSNLTVNAVIQNHTVATASALTKLGPGTVVLAGANTYTGPTTVNGGKLTIASTGTINTTSAISIAGGEFNYNSTTALSKSVTFSGTGGILSGTGTITPLVAVTAGNTLAPGTSIGTLSFGTGLTLAGTYAAQLGTPNATPASGVSDRAAVTGALTLTNGILSLSDNAGANGQGSAGAGAYRLMTFSGARSTFFASVINPLSATLHESVVYTGTTNGSVDLNLYRLAAANTLATPVSLGTVRAGGSFGTVALAIQNMSAGDGFSEGLNASGGAATGAASIAGSVTNLAAGSTNSTSLVVGLGGNANTGTAGLKTGTVTVNLASNGSTTSGYGATALTSQTLTVTGQVYSGLMVWNGATGGTWSANANWNDAQAADIHMAPGLDAVFTSVDTATFGNTSGSVSVNLDGAAPSLNAVTFNSTGSYTIAQGSGITGITLAGTTPGITAAGTHTISAPLALAGNVAISPTNPGDSLTLSGVISGSGRNLTKNGAGTLTLNAANTYSGDTTVANGTLAIGAAGSLPNTGVTINSTGTLAGTGTLGGPTTIQGNHAPGNSSVGLQTFSNNLTYAATSRLQWQLSDNVTAVRGANFDRRQRRRRHFRHRRWRHD